MFAVFAVAAAQSPDAQAEVLRSDSSVNVDSFSYAYETSNGISAQEQGQLKQVGAEVGIATQGQVSKTDESFLSMPTNNNSMATRVLEFYCIAFRSVFMRLTGFAWNTFDGAGASRSIFMQFGLVSLARISIALP